MDELNRAPGLEPLPAPSDVSRTLFTHYRALLIGQGVTLLANFVTGVYLTRTLTPERFGVYWWAYTVLAYLMFVADAGLSIFAVRQVSRDPASAPRVVPQVLLVRLVLALGIFFAVTIVAASAPGAGHPGKLLMIFFFSLALLPSALSVEWAYQALGRMGSVGTARAASAGVFLAGCLLWVKNDADLLHIPILFALSQAIVACGLLLNLRVTFARREVGEMLDDGVRMLTHAMPFFWMGFLVQVYHGADVLMLGWLGSNSDVAWYGIANRLVMISMIAVSLLTQAAFPLLSRMSGDPASSRAVRRAYLRLAAILGVTLMAALWAVGGLFVRTVYGEAYAPAVPLLILLAPAILCVSLNGPFSQSLLAKGHESAMLKLVAALAVFNAAGNALFIPKAGAHAAAVVFTLTEALALAGVVMMHRRLIGSDGEAVEGRCPVCGKSGPKAPRGSIGAYRQFLCLSCDVVYTDPMTEMSPAECGSLAEYDMRRRAPRRLSWNHQSFLRDRPAPGGVLLDIGCGSGELVAAAGAADYEALGLEPIPQWASLAKNRCGEGRIFSGSLKEFLASKADSVFDVVTFFEVLEHQADPEDFLRDVHRLLKPGGYIALSVPNRARWFDTETLRRDIDHPPHHLTKWNASGLAGFLSRHGFEPVRVVVSNVAAWRDTLYFCCTSGRSASGASSIDTSSGPSGPRRILKFGLSVLAYLTYPFPRLFGFQYKLIYILARKTA